MEKEANYEVKEETKTEEKEGNSKRYPWLIPAIIVAIIAVVVVVVVVVVVLVATKSSDDDKVTQSSYSKELFQGLDEEDQELVASSEDLSTIDTADSSIVIDTQTYTASYQITDGKKIYCLATEEQTFSSTTDDQNVFLVVEGSQLVLSGKITISKTVKESGSSAVSNGVVSGTNSVIVVSGEQSSASLYTVTITTDVENSHALLTMFQGRAKLSECTIHTEGASSSGLYVLSTSVVTGSQTSISTEGSNSPLVFSSGEVTLDSSDGAAAHAQILVLDGAGKVTTTGCTFTCSAEGATKDADGGVVDNAAVVFYSTVEITGTESAPTAVFTDTDSVFSILDTSSVYTRSPFFFVTNTKASITLKNTKCNYYNLYSFITAESAVWGAEGTNGGIVTCEATSITRSSPIISADSLSKITETGIASAIAPSQYHLDFSHYTTDLYLIHSGVYTLTGTLQHTLYIAAESVALILEGCTITSPTTAALVNLHAADFTIHVLPDTTNTFSDFKDGTDEYDACIYSNGHLIIQGSETGVINVNGNRKRGIATNAQDITISGGAGINIVSAQEGLIAEGEGGTITIIGGNTYIESGATGIVTKRDALFREGIIYSPGSSIDCTQGYTVDGVTIVALGDGVLENPPKESNQYCFSFTLPSQVAQNTLVVLTDWKDDPVIAFDARKSFTKLIITLPSLTLGTYKLYTGGTIDTTALNHFYPLESATYTKGTPVTIGTCESFAIDESSEGVISYDSTCTTPDDGGDTTPVGPDPDEDITQPELEIFTVTHPVQSRVGISYSITDENVARTVPGETKDGGLGRYPVYGTAMNVADLDSAAATTLKQNIINENKEMLSTTSMNLGGNLDHYDHMDQNGYFYLNGEKVKDSTGNNDLQLFKHTASVKMYYGDVSDDEKAITKTVTITPRGGGTYITGVYAPPGENVKITISESDLAAIGSVPIYIGQVYSNGVALTIGEAGTFTRMPTHCNRFILDQETIYAGFHLGGPIYIGTPTKSAKFSVTLSGGVPYPHFILGYTTEEEYEKSKRGTAPYFDWEVWDDSVRVSGARQYAESLTWQDLYDVATLWDKISRVSNLIPQYGNTGLGIVVLCGPHVACGAACALQGQNTVTLPDGWMSSSLDAAGFIKNGGWGNIHELNHHYQRYGLPGGGEVTNNAINIVEYSLFTLVGVDRSLTLDLQNTWNRFTDPWYSLRRTLYADTERPIVALSAYMNIFHTFGHAKFIEAAQYANGITGAETYYNALTDTMHYDFTYYFTNVLYYDETGTGSYQFSQAVKEAAAAKNYPPFVPLACLYQTGRGYTIDGVKYYSKTAHPYRIYFSDTFTFSLEDALVYPAGVTVQYKSHTAPQYGSLVSNEDGTFTYIPDSTHRTSGDMIFTFSVTMDDNSFDVDDVELVFCFDAEVSTPARTTYYYDDGNAPSSITDILDNGYGTYSSTTTWKWVTPALWWDGDGVKLDCATSYSAKAYITADKSYRIALRGKQASLHIWNSDKSIDERITVTAFINHYDKHSIPQGYYRDITVTKGDVLYFHVDMLSADLTQCFFEIGASVKADDDSYPTPEIITKTFSLYHPEYEPETYETDYFVSRSYSGSATTVTPTQQTVQKDKSENIDYWDNSAEYSIDHLFDGDSTTVYHSQRNHQVTSYPLSLEVKLDGTYVLNSMTIVGRSNPDTPVSFKLYGGTSHDDLELIKEVTDNPLTNSRDAVITFPPVSFSYYKLVVTKTSLNNYVAATGIYFYLSGKETSPDSTELTYRGGWNWVAQHSAYGHVYTSFSGTIDFSFTGTTLVMMTADDVNEQKFTVSFDGGEEKEITVPAHTDGQAFAEVLDEDTKHTVHIKTTTYIKFASFITL